METKCDFMVNRAILIEMGFKPSQQLLATVG